jgi:hypothetical protein
MLALYNWPSNWSSEVAPAYWGRQEQQVPPLRYAPVEMTLLLVMKSKFLNRSVISTGA